MKKGESEAIVAWSTGREEEMGRYVFFEWLRQADNRAGGT
jgi:hypothetical protein